ncbi:MAG: hypothetical protein P8179_24835 [Candidatus Thiodiazotropha sp.]
MPGSCHCPETLLPSALIPPLFGTFWLAGQITGQPTPCPISDNNQRKSFSVTTPRLAQQVALGEASCFNVRNNQLNSVGGRVYIPEVLPSPVDHRHLTRYLFS